ncbi:GNAT family N-acetyltransferase [Vibrio fluvialis]|uniref:GNAT family N-acetyltransferase n=1 Tax=Vibrio fluvialis TaxID=676 RepID=UPI001EEABAF7|nr:GNAT family N-acetyltransferase [Vibrio fluvialis]MCG6398984.1 GNAT family N-acetyltransferase [Vibrio fluvialis]
MENRVTIRKASREDSGKIFELIEQKAEFDRSMKGFDGKISTSIAKIEHTLFGDYPFAHVLLIECKREVVGFALYHYRYSSFSGQPSIWLDDLLIVGQHRSNGYGHALMQALKREAQASLASHIAWTASPHNSRAHEFDTRVGAEIERVDDQRPYFRWSMLSKHGAGK